MVVGDKFAIVREVVAVVAVVSATLAVELVVAIVGQQVAVEC